LVAWSESKIWTKGMAWDEESKLRGPRFIWNQYPLPRRRYWKGFCFVNACVDLYYNLQSGPTVSEIWRYPRYDSSETETLPTHLFYLAAPAWCLPFTAAIFLVLWIALAGMPRIRQYNRLRSGRCTKCGYDLRETPSRCPECGHLALDHWAQLNEWRMAIMGVGCILCIIVLFFAWLAR
jgi:hypothetical protein